MRKVLIADRGESAVRVVRACREAGITSVAVHTAADRHAPHIVEADEAYTLTGDPAAVGDLDSSQVLAAAEEAGVDAIHPGCGALAQDADFAQAVLDAGITWIGPPPQVIRDLGDEAASGHIARRAGVTAARATPDRARQVETQCLADRHGNVVVVSTRDCSLRLHHRSLVAEAPAPFLSAEQSAELRAVSEAVLREAGYVGAGTVRFLVGADGTLSFTGVGTCLAVEHPVTEEVTGIDLVREMFRIADGEDLGRDHPEPRGHAFEFHVGGEDPGRGFRPTAGTVTALTAPSGPGIRVDAGVRTGGTVGPARDDSLLAKLIVTGSTRVRALQRAARALADLSVEGVATAVPFYRDVVRNPAFAPELTGSTDPFTVHTRWIETEYVNEIPAFTAPTGTGIGTGTDAEPVRETVVVEVGGERLRVSLLSSPTLPSAPGPARVARRRRRAPRRPGLAARGDTLTAPMQGTVVEIAVEEGQQVNEGDLVVLLEAMKMEQPLKAHRAGTVVGLAAGVGDSLAPGATICVIKD
ncbi:biotin carboxylase N-terminal domain-containing protein [Streptomyces tendae]|uniref:biotin carboxylase N-terminal domain-containing protein n=1 Tax=Streptomyces tendae TaxID=1932 RepID=UPI0034487E20